MARLASFIEETTTTTGTGNLTLAGASTNRKTINAEYGTNSRFPYVIEHENTDWEEGIGYLSASTTLVRETVLRSSNADAAVNFGAGTKTIAVDFVSQMQYGFVTKAQSVTTADITGQAGVSYDLDISGTTVASKNFIVPVPDAIGEMIQVNIILGDADFALIIKGAATVTLNGGTAATEWSRLFITGETVTLKSTSLTNWNIIIDGRIAQSCRLYGSGITDQQLTTNPAAWTVLNSNMLGVSLWDVGGMADTTNARIYPRRSGNYILTGSLTMSTLLSAINYLRINVKNDVSGNNLITSPFTYTTAVQQGGVLATSNMQFDIATNNYIYIQARVKNNDTGTIYIESGSNTYFECTEVL